MPHNESFGPSPEPALCTTIRTVSKRDGVGWTKASAFGGATLAIGTLLLLSVAAGPASAQTTDYPPNIPPSLVPPASALPAPPPGPSVLGIVVESTTTTTKLPAPAVVLGASLAAPAKPNTEVLGNTITAPVAFTGANSAPTALAGLGLFAAGSALVIGARRRSTPRRCA